MTDNEILHKFLVSRGFSNVRSSGKVLDAAAVFHNSTFAFKVAHCNRIVNKASNKRFIISDQGNIKDCYEFSRSVGYCNFVIVCFYSNKVFSLTEITEEPLDWMHIEITPKAFWRYRELLEEIFFFREYGDKIKIKKKRSADLLIICNGLRYKSVKGETMSFDCFFRDECKRYISWKRYDKAKREGRLHKLYYPRDLKYLKPVIRHFSELGCPDFKKKIQLQTKIEMKDERKK